MVRKNLKKISKSEKIKEFIKKYKVPSEYLSTNRKMVVRGVTLGIFIAFIPMPMQMAAVLAFMPFFKFNVPLGLAMCWLSNPFTMPPMYYMEYLTGSFFLGIKPEPVELTVDWFMNNLDNIFIPLYTGTLFYSVVGSSLAFWLVNHFWKGSVHKDRKLHRDDRKS
ncbi:DUF2062 domain-containing protein [Sulfurimonas sp.]|uniref:DUF2062 domain-containing protein n=1 Tax=Sulfurimonas sp. TaxID=2022749 RepID=UPI0035673933